MLIQAKPAFTLTRLRTKLYTNRIFTHQTDKSRDILQIELRNHKFVMITAGSI